ncbi:phytoene desaturase [Polyplosphaeria fusca]|uniref:Phytoene desaturase n=1 Tax=Polyplosphaeria fusca TaxID=682080 RepID=A0A9P4QM91_9PLEO|nr:phytoene desaturase [Polyplosphaeria fusca]
MGDATNKPSVIIIGAGIGGVATAARLAHAGCKVTVVEKNDFTGGRCSLIHDDGYASFKTARCGIAHRFDQGPSLLLLPRLFHETFRELGTSMQDEGIELVKCEPNYNIHFHDGVRFRMSSDLAVMKEEVERFEGKDGFERYLSFLREAHRHYELSVTHVLRRNFYSLFSMLRLSFLRHLLALHPFESIYGRASKYFWTERLRRVFTFASMYMGMSPFDAPGTYSLLQYTELAEGIWYPVGGFHKVVDALVQIGKRKNVSYLLSTSVSQIKLSKNGKRATGVVLSSGHTLTADITICNADLTYAYTALLPPTPYSRTLSTRPASCSSLSFYWSLNTQFPSLTAHNIFLASAYKSSFDSIFKHHAIPSEPSFYLNVPSRVDASAAPAGTDALVVLVPVGHLLPPSSSSASQQDWSKTVASARETVLRTIESRLGIALAPHIVHEIVNTPLTWKSRFNLDRGAILGLSHSFWNVLSFRPKTRHASVEGLYFVGASTHPGTGVPIVLAGARLVVQQVLGIRGGERKEGRGEGLDRVQGEPMLSWLYWIVLVVVGAVLAVLKYVSEGWDWRQGSFAGDW